MRYLKLFEELIKDEPEVGDYVIANSPIVSKRLQDFFLTNVGKIIDITEYHLKVEYESSDIISLYTTTTDLDGNILPEKSNFWSFSLNRSSFSKGFYNDDVVLYFSSDKKDVEDMIPILSQEKKYNL